MEREEWKKTCITDLHESLIVYIFFFLSAKSILRCKSVCKTWATLISQLSYFSTTTKPPLHLLPIQLLLNGGVAMLHQYLLLTEFDPHQSSDSESEPLPITKSLIPNNILDSQSSSAPRLYICSVCNFTGFVVAYTFPVNDFGGVEHPYHLFNPLTAQYILVQHNTKRPTVPKDCALLFAPKTNQLKLLIFVYQSLHADIQTIDGTGTWRTIGHTPRPYYPENSGFPVFLNGAYHWFCSYYRRSSVICVFNAEDEVFHEISTPSSTQDFLCSDIGLLDDRLCICMKEEVFEFWVMNDYGVPESWTKKFVIPNTILRLNVHRVFEPLKILENGEILILCHGNEVLSYNLNTKSCKVIKKYYGKSFISYETIRYVPCFSKMYGLNGEIL